MKIQTIILLFLLLNTILADAQVRVPQEDNIIVTLDGIFGLQEWDNSLKIPLEENYYLHLVANRDWLYLAVFGRNVIPGRLYQFMIELAPLDWLTHKMIK